MINKLQYLIELYRVILLYKNGAQHVKSKIKVNITKTDKIQKEQVNKRKKRKRIDRETESVGKIDKQRKKPTRKNLRDE